MPPPNQVQMVGTMKRTLVKPEDVYLTVAEVAELDSCSEKTVRRAIDAGRLEVVRIGSTGRSIRISKAAHAAYRKRLTRWS